MANVNQIEDDKLFDTKFKNGINAQHPKYKICLNMIVKNESKVIQRLIGTVKDYIDYYIISDTGSNDNTIQIIKNEMNKYEIPGEIYENPWKNFAHNREIALRYVYLNNNCEYIMTIDADEEFRVGIQIDKATDFFTNLTKDVYHLKKKFLGNEYYVPFLLKMTKVKWTWRGPVHNYIDLLEHHGKTTHEYVDGNDMYIHVNYHEGSKSHNMSSKEKYLKDAKILAEEVRKNPNDSRSQFYLAQSYYDAADFQSASRAYDKRIEMGGWAEEVFYSKYRKGMCAIMMDKPYSEILELLLAAYEYRPGRIEPLYELVTYCRDNKLYAQGYLFGKFASTMDVTKDLLFVNHNVYSYLLLDQYSLCAYYSGHYNDSKDALMKLLREKKYPDEFEDRYKMNLRYALEGIKQKMHRNNAIKNDETFIRSSNITID